MTLLELDYHILESVLVFVVLLLLEQGRLVLESQSRPLVLLKFLSCHQTQIDLHQYQLKFFITFTILHHFHYCIHSLYPDHLDKDHLHFVVHLNHNPLLQFERSHRV